MKGQDAILAALEKTMPKSNEIAAFTKLRSLKQGDMPLSEFIRRLAELYNYPNDQDRLIRDTIVSGVYSLRSYQKCISAKDLSLQECIIFAKRKMPSECKYKNTDQSLWTLSRASRL